MKKQHTLVFSRGIAKDLFRKGFKPVEVKSRWDEPHRLMWIYETTPELEKAIEKAEKYLGVKGTFN